MKQFTNKTRIIICSTILAAIAILIGTVVLSKTSAKAGTRDDGVTAVNPAVTPATVENPDRSENPEANQEEKAKEELIEYDISAIKEEDIETALVAGVKVDDDRNVTLKLEDGSTVEAGNIGGEKIQGTVTVVFVDYDNSIIKAEMVEKGTGATPPASPVRTGYEFIGWSGNYANPTEDTVISAAYVKKGSYYTVTFRDYDGREIRVEIVAAGGSAAGPSEEPGRDGYIFVGWDCDLDQIDSDVIATAMYAASDAPLIQAAAVSAQPGEKNVAVTLSLKNNPGICSLRLDTEFGSGLTLNKYEFSGEIGGSSMGPKSVPATDSATFLWYLYDKDLKEDAAIVTLYFDVDEDAQGRQNICLSYDADDIFNIDGENVEFCVINGSIEVIDDSSPTK